MPVSMFCHPYLMAACAAVAIGLVVYEIVTKKHEEKMSCRRPRRPRPSGPTDSPPPKHPPTSASHLECSLDYSSSSDTKDDFRCEVRKRNVISLKPDVSKQAVKKRLNGTQPKKSTEPHNLQSEGQKLSNLDYQNVDKNIYEKNVYDKILNETKSVNMKTKTVQNISKNISDEDSDSENITSEKTNNFKESNVEVSDEPVYFPNGSNNLSQTSKEEEIYKKNISENIKCQEAMKTEHVSQEKENVCQEAMKTEHVSQEKEGNVGQEAMKDKNVSESQEACGVSNINFNVTQGICSGCEEAPINAVAYPCGHSYLCLECAKIIFRIHKTCSVCLTDIVKFEF